MALAVVVYHGLTRLGWTLQGADPLWQRGVAKAGVYAVEGFFILSGFAMFHVYRHAGLDLPWLRRFYSRRFLRLAPLFYVVLGVNLLFDLPAAGFATPAMIAENVGLLFGFHHPNRALVTGGWSIGVEAVFYVAFPLLVVVGRRGWPWIAAMAVALWLWSLAHNLRVVPGTPLEGRFHAYVQVRNHAFLFLLGGLVAELRARVPWRLPCGVGALVMASLALLAVLWRPDFERHVDMMGGSTRYGLLSLCWALIATASVTDLGGLPGRRLVPAFGNLSYGIYLLHPLVLAAILAARPRLGSDLACLAVTLALTLGLSTLSWRYLERPALDLSRPRTSA